MELGGNQRQENVGRNVNGGEIGAHSGLGRDNVNLTVRVNTTKRDSQRAQLEHYFLGCVS